MKSPTICIRGGRVIDPSRGFDKTADLLIAEGRIAALEENITPPKETEIIDAKGLVVAPGLIDMHVHLRDPGQEYKEDIRSGTKAATVGGFTAVAAMANTDPVCDSPSGVRYLLEQAASAHARVYPIGAVTKGLKGKELAEMGRMKKAGAVAFSDDGCPVMDSRLMYHALQYASGLGALLLLHEEDLTLSEGGAIHEGAISSFLGLRGIPAASEEALISRDLLLLKMTGGRMHICHLSAAGSVEQVRQAKAQGLQVTAEVTPHHLLLTDEVVKALSFDTDTKVNPPLRTEKDRLALWEGLFDGTIDAIASDHAPHHPDDKDVEYDFAPFGINGLETTLPLLLHELSQGLDERLTLPFLIEKLSTAPAKILQVPGGSLAPGQPADVTVIDLEKEYLVAPEKWQSKSRNTPFKGRQLKGAALYTIVGGQVMMKEGVPTDH